MKLHQFLFRLGNKLYENCYPAYYPLYTTWKIVSDRRERRLFRQLIRPGMTVVDVGANIGVYTRYFARLAGKGGRIHAFEPAYSNFKRLQKNVGHLPNVSLNCAAVGNRRGTIKLYVSSELNVDHRTYESGDGRHSIEVPIVSLDDYFLAGQQIDLIKIDVQGYELSVLQGAMRLLKENRDIRLIIEFWPYGLTKASVAPSDLIELLQSVGFEIRTTADPVGPLFEGAGFDPTCVDHYCNLLVARHPGAET